MSVSPRTSTSPEKVSVLTVVSTSTVPEYVKIPLVLITLPPSVLASTVPEKHNVPDILTLPVSKEYVTIHHVMTQQ